MSVFRPVLSLILAVGLLQLSGGLLGVVTPLGLGAMGVGQIGIGAVAALHGLGLMVGAYFSPQLISIFGNIRTFAAAAAITAIGALAMGLTLDGKAWALMRTLQGAGFAVMFASAEAWLGVAAAPSQRGNVLGVYHVVAKLALFSGPLLVIGLAALAPQQFLWAGLFLAGALVPICFTDQVEPQRQPIERLPFFRMLKLAPSALTAAFFAGVINTGTIALLPVYAASYADAGSRVGAAAIAFAAANIGGLLLQWPAGKVSDRFDRRTVIAVLSLVSGIAALALFLLNNVLGTTSRMVLIGLWGTGALSFYSVAVAHGVDRSREEDAPALMSTILLVWAGGSVIGPVVAGLLMSGGGHPERLMLLSIFGFALLSVIMLVRRANTKAVPDAEQEDWQPALPTGLAGTDLDPRADTSEDAAETQLSPA